MKSQVLYQRRVQRADGPLFSILLKNTFIIKPSSTFSRTVLKELETHFENSELAARLEKCETNDATL